MMTANPFTISFGRKPENYISREIVSSEIIDCFSSDSPFTNTYILTGVRGMGKTVTMTAVANHFKKLDEWIVIDLNPSRNLLDAFGARLYDALIKNKYELKAINPSAFGVSVLSMEKKDDPVFDIELFNDKLLQTALSKGKKILITIDEAANSSYMRQFALSFQGMLRNEYPVFLLMTGLFQNVTDIQNDKSLTFLLRAKRIDLESLNLSLIKKSYQNILAVPSDQARKMAELTRGYPFAYQVLGYLVFENPSESLSKLMDRYDSYLQSYVYEKIWQESSGNDREFLTAMSKVKGNIKQTAEIKAKSQMDDKTFSVYRDRLIKRGIVKAVKYGEVMFALPRFEEYVQQVNEFDLY